MNNKQKQSSSSSYSSKTNYRCLPTNSKRTKSPTSTVSSKGATTTTQDKLATASKYPKIPTNSLVENPNFIYASPAEMREKHKYTALHICADSLQGCLKLEKSIKEQIILIMSLRYLFDQNTLKSMHYKKAYSSCEELFEDFFKLYDVCYVLDMQSMYNKDHDIVSIGPISMAVVTCAFIQIE